jgi:hypothetical protein
MLSLEYTLSVAFLHFMPTGSKAPEIRLGGHPATEAVPDHRQPMLPHYTFSASTVPVWKSVIPVLQYMPPPDCGGLALTATNG